MKKSLLGSVLFTLLGLYGFLVAFVVVIFLLCDVPVSIALFSAIVVLVLQFLISPWLTDITMKFFYKVKYDYKMPEYFEKFVLEVCAQNNMKYPKIGYIDDGAPNAFTYGRTKNDARIILTRGIFELLSEEEVKAVVAHEIGHAAHYDMLFMTAAQLVPIVLYFIYDMCASGDSSDDNSKTALVGVIAYILYIISQFVVLSLSRSREYYADSFSVIHTKNPSALANALVKIGYGLTTSTNRQSRMSASKMNALGIFDAKASKSLIVSSYDDGCISQDNIKKAMRWEMWNPWAKWYEFFSTHPLISKRLLAISAKSSEFNQIPYIAFDDNKPESYVDDFLGECLLLNSFWVIVIIGIILVIMSEITSAEIFMYLFWFLPFVAFCLSLIKINRSHKNRNYKNCKVSDLISEVKVSKITSVPCIVEGVIIGREDPGCIFDDDLVIKDDTGIIFIKNRRLLPFMKTIAGLVSTKNEIDKKAVVKGWYRRHPVPYVEIYEIQIEGMKKKRFYSAWVGKIFYGILVILSFCFGLLFLL